MRRIWGIFLLMSILLTACTGGGGAVSARGESSVAGTEGTAADTEVSSPEEVTGGASEDAPDEPHVLRPAIMVDGVLYYDTGYNSSLLRCGNLDGEVSGTVPATEFPTKDGQVNFEGAEGWQIGFEEGTVDVFMDNRFRIFASEGTYAKEEIPAGVGCMMGTVMSIRGDGYFVFRPTSVPEAFSHFATEREELPPEALLQLDSEREYLVPVSAMENDPAFPVKEGEVNWSLVADGVVMVYCDTFVKEGDPLVLENVYHVFRVGSSPMLHAGNPIQRKLDEMLSGLV